MNFCLLNSRRYPRARFLTLGQPISLSLSHFNPKPPSHHDPGPGFVTFHLPPPLNTVTLAICMDLNPRSTWTFDGGPYELAEHCLKTGSDLLILLNAWLDSESDQERAEDFPTMNYWATMLRPLWDRRASSTTTGGSESSNREGSSSGPPRESGDAETVVVVCNRSGVENGEQGPFASLNESSPERGALKSL